MEPSDFERGFRAVGVLDTLKNTAEFLASVRGRRKAVLFFSEGIDYPIYDSFGSQSATDVIRATQDAITMAARANVNYYTIDPRGLVGMTNEFMEMAGGGSPELAGGPADLQPGTGARITRVTGGRPFNAQTELMNELQLSQGSLRELAEADRRHRLGQHELADQRVRAASCRRTAAITCSAITRRRIRATGDSTKSKFASSARACASRRARDTDRRAAGPRKSGNATKRRGAARSQTPERRQDVDRASRRAHKPAAAERAQLHRAGRAVQEHAEGSVGRARDRDRRRSAAVSPPNEKGLVANKIELSFYGISDQGKAMAGTRSRARSDAAARDARARQGRTASASTRASAFRPGGISCASARASGRRADGHGVLRPRGSRFPKRETDDGRPAARLAPRLSRRRASSPIRCSRR